MSEKELQNIIYVEDDEDIRAIAQIALEDVGGLRVHYCASASALLHVLQSKEFQPDIFLLDVMLPEMDGPTLLSKVREMPEYADIPVIFMTAKVQIDEIDKYKKMGVLEIISKPFDPMKLASTIQHAWKAHYER